MLFKIPFIMTAAAVAAVNAQGTVTSPPAPSALPSITPCALACVQPAAALNGCAYTDASCVCKNAQFQADTDGCIRKHCTSDDWISARGLHISQCGHDPPDVTGYVPTSRDVPFTLPSSATSGAAGTQVSLSATPSISKVTSNGASASGASQTPSTAASKVGHSASALVGALLAAILAL